MLGQYRQFFAWMDVACEKRTDYVIEALIEAIRSVIAYHKQEWKEDQRYFGHCPGHFEVALGFLSNSPGTTDFCTEVTPFLYDWLKIKHLSVA